MATGARLPTRLATDDTIYAVASAFGSTKIVIDPATGGAYRSRTRRSVSARSARTRAN